DHAAFFATDVGDERQLLEANQTLFDDGGRTARRFEDAGRREFIERGEDGGTAKRVGAPGVGAFAVVESAEECRGADRRRDGDAVAQAFAEDDDVGLQAIGLKREQVAGAAEVRLHLIENENDVILPAKLLQRLQIFLGWMIRPAAADVRLRDEYAELTAKLILERIE